MLRTVLVIGCAAACGAESLGFVSSGLLRSSGGLRSSGFRAEGLRAEGLRAEGLGAEELRVRAPRAAGFKLRMQAPQEPKPAAMVGRRAALGAFLLGAQVFAAQGASAASEGEEFKKLQAEAERLNSLFNSQKVANEGLPSLRETAKEALASPKGGSKASPSPELKPEDVVSTLMQAMKENDDKDSGLKKIVEFSSPNNPIKQAPFNQFVMQMKNSKYNVLLGNFEKFKVAKMESQKDSTGQYTIVDVAVMAPYKTMLVNGMDFDYIKTNKEGDSEITVRWQLSFDTSSKCWLSDTVYLVEPEQTGPRV